MDIYSAWKILCTYRVMYSVHVRRMYRANLGVCSPDRGETRAGRGEEDDFYVNICETLRRHDDAAHILDTRPPSPPNTFPPQSPPLDRDEVERKISNQIDLAGLLDDLERDVFKKSMFRRLTAPPVNLGHVRFPN